MGRFFAPTIIASTGTDASELRSVCAVADPTGRLVAVTMHIVTNTAKTHTAKKIFSMTTSGKWIANVSLGTSLVRTHALVVQCRDPILWFEAAFCLLLLHPATF
jgi:hypothetical protein